MQSKGVIDDVGRHLAQKWSRENPDGSNEDNPWNLKRVAKIKSEFDDDPEGTKEKYPELFYYYDGLLGTKISQSVHPAGMVISPITLDDNYGTFDKDGDTCLLLDMDNIHEFTGLAKYDFLILKTVQVIRDTCVYLNQPYPKTHEIDWDDQDVWSDMISNPSGIFQFESQFAFRSLRQFKPKNIFDMSIVTACIRPSGESYRDDLLRRKHHKNPSRIIDDLLKDNLGYLIYQEDTIKFLQQVCGLSGSEADNIRRAIGRKQKDRLDAVMPSILDGYCSKSLQPREVAEQEAKEFLQVIEDSASYQFGYNHSIAYCLLGYLCAYYRHYHPIEFITAFLNNAANDDDIKTGTQYARTVGIEVTTPKWGISKSEYFFDSDERIITKGLASIKYMSDSVANELYNLAHDRKFRRFVDVLYAISDDTSVNTRQLDILIKLDFFSDFGNQKELTQIADLFYNVFRRGTAKRLARNKVDDLILEEVVEKYSIGMTKAGVKSASYTLLDVRSILEELEDRIKETNDGDFDSVMKSRNYAEALGYAGYVSGEKEDRPKLYITDVYPVKSKAGRQFGYVVSTKSIGSGIESKFTILNRVFKQNPLKKDDIILCRSWIKDKSYYQMDSYRKLE